MNSLRRPSGVLYLLATAAVFNQTGCQRLLSPLLPPKRLSGIESGIVIPESINLERTDGATSLVLNFETTVPAACKVGFVPSNAGSDPSKAVMADCAGKSTTRFSETITGLPKDQLVTLFLKAWPAASAEPPSPTIKIPEVSPSADARTISLFMVDLDAKWAELTAIENDKTPSAIVSDLTKSRPSGCLAAEGLPPSLTGNRKATFIQSASVRGLVNSSLTRLSTSVLGASFNMTQRDSSEWSITAKTTEGFGQIRFAKPALLTNAIFAGSQQSEGLDDDLADIDPPVVRLLGSSTFVATWSVDGDPKNAVATLTVQRAPGFGGIVCTANAGAGRIVIPSEFITKIPTGVKLWTTLRLDSWQSFDKERWLVRSSNWSSMGVQRI